MWSRYGTTQRELATSTGGSTPPRSSGSCRTRLRLVACTIDPFSRRWFYDAQTQNTSVNSAREKIKTLWAWAHSKDWSGFLRAAFRRRCSSRSSSISHRGRLNVAAAQNYASLRCRTSRLEAPKRTTGTSQVTLCYLWFVRKNWTRFYSNRRATLFLRSQNNWMCMVKRK